jgi:hypothetical protein
MGALIGCMESWTRGGELKETGLTLDEGAAGEHMDVSLFWLTFKVGLT